MRGKLIELELEVDALAGNPLGDPSRRTVLVYLPPGQDGRAPPDRHLPARVQRQRPGLAQRELVPAHRPERIDAQVVSGVLPPFVAVFPDGATRLGGTQWTDAPAVGRYQTYVAEAVVREVEARFGTLPVREARAIVGKSSGGYGALRMGRDRPDVFAHVGSHSGDACFEYCYLSDFPKAAAA